MSFLFCYNPDANLTSMSPWHPSDMSNWKCEVWVRPVRLVGSDSRWLLGWQMGVVATHGQANVAVNVESCERTKEWRHRFPVQLPPNEQQFWQRGLEILITCIWITCIWTIFFVDSWSQKWEINRSCSMLLVTICFVLFFLASLAPDIWFTAHVVDFNFSSAV